MADKNPLEPNKKGSLKWKGKRYLTVKDLFNKTDKSIHALLLEQAKKKYGAKA